MLRRAEVSHRCSPTLTFFFGGGQAGVSQGTHDPDFDTSVRDRSWIPFPGVSPVTSAQPKSSHRDGIPAIATNGKTGTPRTGGPRLRLAEKINTYVGMSPIPTHHGVQPRGANFVKSRKERVHLLSGIAAVVSLGLLLGGCGGSPETDAAAPTTPVTREAAAAFKPDKSTCTERGPSYTFTSSIINRLPVAIRLDAGEYECNDWSGTRTPGHAFTGKILQPGEKLTIVLEAVKYTTRWWTLMISPIDGGPAFGTARLSMPQTALTEDHIEILGSTQVWLPKNENLSYCSVLEMGSTSVSSTDQRDYPEYYNHLGVVSYNGRVSLAGYCLLQGM